MLPSSRSFAKQFDLILAPIVSIESSRGGASVTYQRRCNEAPIGLVVGANSMSQASVGVLVASYPNLRCQAELPHAVSETMIEPALRFPSKISLVPMRQQPNVEASLRAPSELTLENGSKGSNLRISYIDIRSRCFGATCRRNVGFGPVVRCGSLWFAAELCT